MSGASADTHMPPRNLVLRWARHLDKLRAACRRQGAPGSPIMRLVMQTRDASRFLTVPDGDGFMFAGLPIRLHGMDAPEYDQECHDDEGRAWPCGERARWRLYELLRGREVCIDVLDVDHYGRLLAICRVGGQDVGSMMVREGWALALDRKLYGEDELIAMRNHSGIWRGYLEDPASWRAKTARRSTNGAKQGGVPHERVVTGEVTGRAANDDRSPAVGEGRSVPGSTASMNRIHRLLADFDSKLEALQNQISTSKSA